MRELEKGAELGFFRSLGTVTVVSELFRLPILSSLPMTPNAKPSSELPWVLSASFRHAYVS